MTLLNPTTPFDSTFIAAAACNQSDGRGFSLTDPGTYRLRAQFPWAYSATDSQAIDDMTPVAKNTDVTITVDDGETVERYIKCPLPYEGNVELFYRSPAEANFVGDGLQDPAVGFRTIPQVSKSADYTTLASDSGKDIFHPSTDANARAFHIASEALVNYPLGTCIGFVNDSAEDVTIDVVSDLLVWLPTGATGQRILAENGACVAKKIGSARWQISGLGLT